MNELEPIFPTRLINELSPSFKTLGSSELASQHMYVNIYLFVYIILHIQGSLVITRWKQGKLGLAHTFIQRNDTNECILSIFFRCGTTPEVNAWRVNKTRCLFISPTSANHENTKAMYFCKYRTQLHLFVCNADAISIAWRAKLKPWQKFPSRARAHQI